MIGNAKNVFRLPELFSSIPHLQLWYLRGLFEADGCVKVNLVRNTRKGVLHENMCIEIQFVSLFKEPCKLFQTHFGGGIYPSTKRKHTEWRITGNDAKEAAYKLMTGTTEKACQLREITKFPIGQKGNTVETKLFKTENRDKRMEIRDTITRMKREGCGKPFVFPECMFIERQAFISGFLDGDGWITSEIGFCQKRYKILEWIKEIYPGGRFVTKMAKANGKLYGPYGYLYYKKEHPISECAELVCLTHKRRMIQK